MPSYACEIYEQISSSEAFFCRPVSSWIPSAIHSFRTPSLNGLFKDTSSGWRREVRVWRKCSQYLSCELQMSRKQASSFSSPGHRSVHFYFLCCVFNVCKLGRAWQTIESVYNTHRDFDACFYGKKSAHYTRVNTVLTRSSVSLPAGFYRQRFGTSVSLRGTWETLNNASRWKVSKSVQHVIFLTRLTSSRGKRSACPAALIVTACSQSHEEAIQRFLTHSFLRLTLSVPRSH